jgi:hypothetical protein
MGANIILIFVMVMTIVGVAYFKYEDWKEEKYAKNSK